MDIYILRDGHETGPFSEETTQTLLKGGAVLVNDLAWTPGLPAWSPLVQVLYPGATAPSSHAATPARVESQPPSEPATARQKAFLSYLGITFPSNITKERAAMLVNEAVENSKLQARVARWNDDRLKLHPELFAAEIQERKENRASLFFDLCEAEGAEIFSGVTKAHCQVLIGYLDVRVPNWDAHESEAARTYFFAAIAEKFPQIVRKPWRDKLKFPDGPRVAAELLQSAPAGPPAGPMSRRGLPIAAAVRGVVFGLGILLLLYIGQQMLIGDNTRPAPAPAPEPVAPKAKVEPAPKPAAPVTAITPPIAEVPGTPAQPPREMKPEVIADTPPPAAKESLFDAVPATPPAEPAAPAPRTHLVITKVTEVALRFGTAKLPVGTRLKIIAQNGSTVKVLNGSEEVVIPIEATDLPVATEPAPVP